MRQLWRCINELYMYISQHTNGSRKTTETTTNIVGITTNQPTLNLMLYPSLILLQYSVHSSKHSIKHSHMCYVSRDTAPFLLVSVVIVLLPCHVIFPVSIVQSFARITYFLTTANKRVQHGISSLLKSIIGLYSTDYPEWPNKKSATHRFLNQI